MGIGDVRVFGGILLFCEADRNSSPFRPKDKALPPNVQPLRGSGNLDPNLKGEGHVRELLHTLEELGCGALVSLAGDALPCGARNEETGGE